MSKSAMYRGRQCQNAARGMTLVETLIAVGIIFLVAGGVIMFQQNIIRSSQVLQRNLLREQEVRRTLNTFTKEVRSTIQSEAGAYAIEAAGTSSIVFFSDIDRDGVVERVRYFLSTSTDPTVFDIVKKGVIEPSGSVYNASNEVLHTVAQNVRNNPTIPLFSYYDATYDGATAPLTLPIDIPLVRLVKMEIVVDADGPRGERTRSFSTQVNLRNLKDNL